ncbi:hypothetical protein BC830DRAFT_1096842 [Chytriomyces sp. MP71]|nr:hypothetical protein BC830DRAFT_1096842 [Chytriomyces sp. MP71]
MPKTSAADGSRSAAGDSATPAAPTGKRRVVRSSEERKALLNREAQRKHRQKKDDRIAELVAQVAHLERRLNDTFRSLSPPRISTLSIPANPDPVPPSTSSLDPPSPSSSSSGSPVAVASASVSVSEQSCATADRLISPPVSQQLPYSDEQELLALQLVDHIALLRKQIANLEIENRLLLEQNNGLAAFSPPAMLQNSNVNAFQPCQYQSNDWISSYEDADPALASWSHQNPYWVAMQNTTGSTDWFMPPILPVFPTLPVYNFSNLTSIDYTLQTHLLSETNIVPVDERESLEPFFHALLRLPSLHDNVDVKETFDAFKTSIVRTDPWEKRRQIHRLLRSKVRFFAACNALDRVKAVELIDEVKHANAGGVAHMYGTIQRPYDGLPAVVAAERELERRTRAPLPRALLQDVPTFDRFRTVLAGLHWMAPHTGFVDAFCTKFEELCLTQDRERRMETFFCLVDARNTMFAITPPKEQKKVRFLAVSNGLTESVGGQMALAIEVLRTSNVKFVEEFMDEVGYALQNKKT